MSQKTIYPNGVAEIDVPATESIAVSNFGGGIAKIYYLIETANYPSVYQLQQTLNNGSVTLGAFTADTKVKIEAGNSKVYYDVGTAPDTGIGDADTVGGLYPTQFIRKDTADNVNGVITFTVGPVINNAIYISVKESGGTVRAVLGMDGSNVFQIGTTSRAVNIQSNGTVTVPAASIQLDNNQQFLGSKSDGSARSLAYLTSGNITTLANTQQITNIQSNGTLQYNGAALASGTIDTTAAQTITVVDGFITSIV